MTVTPYRSANPDIVSHKPFGKTINEIIHRRENDLDDEEIDSVQVQNLELIKSNNNSIHTSNTTYF